MAITMTIEWLSHRAPVTNLRGKFAKHTGQTQPGESSRLGLSAERSKDGKTQVVSVAPSKNCNSIERVSANLRKSIL